MKDERNQTGTFLEQLLIEWMDCPPWRIFRRLGFMEAVLLTLASDRLNNITKKENEKK